MPARSCWFSKTEASIGSLGDPELDSIVVTQAARFLASRDETRMFSVSEFAPEFPLARETSLLFERLNLRHGWLFVALVTSARRSRSWLRLPVIRPR